MREIGEARALKGLRAQMQGRWKDVFRAESIACVRKSPDKVNMVFDGHLCLAEFCLCNAKGQARRRLDEAERLDTITSSRYSKPLQSRQRNPL